MTTAKKEIVNNNATVPTRRTYQAPRLTEFGDVRHLTQGGTAGLDEVGNQNMNLMA